MDRQSNADRTERLLWVQRDPGKAFVLGLMPSTGARSRRRIVAVDFEASRPFDWEIRLSLFAQQYLAADFLFQLQG